MLKRTAKFRLKYNGKRDEEQGQRLLQEPVDDVQRQPVADNREPQEHEQPLHQCDGARILQHHIEFVKNQCHD